MFNWYEKDNKQIEWIWIEDLIPHYSLRHTNEHLEQLIKSLLDHGWLIPLVVNKRDGKYFVISGNMLYYAALEIWEDSHCIFEDGNLPCNVIEVSKEKEEEIYNILNRTRINNENAQHGVLDEMKISALEKITEWKKNNQI